MKRRAFLAGGVAALVVALLARFEPRRVRPAAAKAQPTALREARFWRRVS